MIVNWKYTEKRECDQKSFLGWIDSEWWRYYDGYRELESLFWETFREEAYNVSDADLYLVCAARIAGLFYCHGFNYDAKGVVWIVRTDRPDGLLAYLDAFCIPGKWWVDSLLPSLAITRFKEGNVVGCCHFIYRQLTLSVYWYLVNLGSERILLYQLFVSNFPDIELSRYDPLA